MQIHLTVAMMQPSVVNTSHSCNFPQRCRGAYRAPADMIQTFDFPPQRPPSSREGDRPQAVEGVLARRRWKEFSRIARPYHPSRALSKPFIQPRVQGRNPARFNGGYGVPRGFKGEKSKSPPNPLGLAERVHRPQAVEGVSRRRKAFAGAGRRKNPAGRDFSLGGVSFMPLVCP